MQLPLIGKVNRPTPWLIGLLTAGVIGTGGITYAVMQANRPATDISAMTVLVESQPLRVRITASGTVQPIQTVNVSPKQAGIVQELYVEQGDRVQQGQVLARMEATDIEAQLTQAQARVSQAQARLEQLRNGNRSQEIDQAEARVSQAQARVREAQSRQRLAEDKVDRNRDLLAQGAISQDRFNEIQNEANTARATVEQLQASVQEAQRNFSLFQSGSRPEEIAQAEAQLQEAIGNLQAVQVRQDDSYIRAPFNGTISQKFANEGAFVTPTTSASEASSATSTAIVAVAQGLEVLAEVPEVDVRQLRVGQSVEVIADAYPDQTFQGRVRLIAPEAVVRQNVTSFQVRITLTSGLDKLRSGMNVDTTFLGDQINNALVVPTVAIVTDEGQTGVLVPDERNKPKFQRVVLGSTVANQTQILEGLKPGDRVFTDTPPEWERERQQERENNQNNNS